MTIFREKAGSRIFNRNLKGGKRREAFVGWKRLVGNSRYLGERVMKFSKQMPRAMNFLKVRSFILISQTFSIEKLTLIRKCKNRFEGERSKNLQTYKLFVRKKIPLYYSDKARLKRLYLFDHTSVKLCLSKLILWYRPNQAMQHLQ